MSLSAEELLRYSRHTLLPEFGMEGQTRLAAARVLIVGVGGLGSPAAIYLAAAGAGTIGLVDFDVVDPTNLQRQILYGSSDVGRPKLEAAAARLSEVNPHVVIERHDERLDPANALQLVSAYDIVIDGTDNFSTRFLVNDACVIAGRPNVYGSVFRFEGQAAVFATPDGPCYRCLHPEPPPAGMIPNCAEAGVLGVLPGIIGLIQATEAIKLITNIGEPLAGKLLLFDALRMRFRQIALPKDPACPVCGPAASIHSLEPETYDVACGTDAAVAEGPKRKLEGSNGGKTTPEVVLEAEMTVEELEAWRRENKPHLLIDVREPSEHATGHIEGAELIPLRQLQSHVKRLPKDRPIVVHCQMGGRSAIATAMLKVQGFQAHNLKGGIQAWNRRGLNK